MKKFKRVLAMSLALVLLLSFSPMFNVSATDADEPTYNQLMHDYKVAASDDFSDESNTLASITDSKPDDVDTIFRDTDEAGNTYLKYCNTASSNYAYLIHGLDSSPGVIVFEADIRWDNPGIGLTVSVRNKGTKIMTIENGEIAFFYTSKASINAPITQGEWHKITYVMDTTAGTAGKFIAFVDEEYVGTGNLPSGTTASTRVGVRFTVSSATDSENEDFFIDNLKWYTPDANGACPDYNKDHICDYGCSEPVGVCGDADGDELCDYGCGKIYSPFNDLMHAYKMAVSRDYFVEDDDLTKSGTAVSGIITLGENITMENKDGVATSGTYIQLYHRLADATKLIFEADLFYNTAGMTVEFTANSSMKVMQLTSAGGLQFLGTGGKTVTLEAGKWYKVTYAYDLSTNKYDAYVNGVREVTGGTPLFTTLTRLRVQVKNDSAIGDLVIDNVKWYTPDANGACPDYDKDHICDYGCSEPVGECGDGDGDNKCDYCGDCVYHTYIIAGDEVHCENCDVAGNVITESGVLDLKGQSVKDGIKVTGEKTILSVVDTSWMTNGLDGKNVGKLIVTEGAEKIETYTQYGDFKYLKVPSEDGTYFTFHPFNLTITRMGLNTAKQETCLEVQFIADNVVRDLLIGENEDHNYGLKNLLTGAEGSVKGVSKYQFTTQSNRAVAYFSLSGSLHNDNIDKEVQFQAYMKLKVGGEEIVILSNYIAKITPRQIMIDLNNSNVEPSDEQQLAKIRAIWTNEDGTDNVNYSELKSILTRFN